MSEGVSKKRAARIERRKSKISAIFKVDEKQENVFCRIEDEQLVEPLQKQPKLSDEEYHTLRIKLREKKRQIQCGPTFRLIQLGLTASLNLPKPSRVPVLVADVQSLFLYTIVGDTYNYDSYKWCDLARWNNLTQTLIFIVEDVSVDEFEENTDIFAETFRIFEDGVEMSNPAKDGFTLDLALAYVPISHQMKNRVMEGYPSLHAACLDGYIHGVADPTVQKVNANTTAESHAVKNHEVLSGQPCGNDITTQEKMGQKNNAADTEKLSRESSDLSNIVETKTIGATRHNEQRRQSTEVDSMNKDEVHVSKIGSSVDDSKSDVSMQEETSGCSRLALLLNASQLISELYPLPGYEEYDNFKFTQDIYDPVTDRSPMFSIDCEWCICVDGSYGLARVAVVDEHLKTLYHTYVKPDVEIADYLTRYSGITEELIRDVEKRPFDVQQDLRNLLPPDAILVGQSLQSDLKALKLFHPYIIDTSVIFNMTGTRSFKSKLKVLAASFCGRQIQNSMDGHDPTEDAIAAMELVMLKMKMGTEFGDLILSRNAMRKIKDSALDHEIQMKLFTFIQSHNRSATLITTSLSLQKSYHPRLLKLKKAVVKCKKADESLVDPVQIVLASDFQDAVTMTRASRFNSSFTLVHTYAGREQHNRKEKLKEIDKAIANMYTGISLNGMMIVIFGGKTNPTQNGACLVRVKKRSI
ncbi:putative RNA exonuclease NEF-sp [Daphnia magna]|uniref:Putative RNA exonuclease NEF-sp n=1 Tax=Daphnia magna TaxID=35525 RepID=A0A164L2J3_9CRUS|nr:putative RNA exonuclease NEF-sp [Daphnia magna]